MRVSQKWLTAIWKYGHKVTEWSNKHAVSVNNLSTAVKKASASLATGNNTFEETLGLVTAGTEVLREPGRVANGRLMPFIYRNIYIVNPLIAGKPYRAL